MNFEYRKLSIALIAIYSACMIFTAYQLFQLPDDLIYKSQVMSASDASLAGPVLMKLYIIVGLTMIVGLVALVISLNKKSSEVIYVEKKENSQVYAQTADKEASNTHTLNLADIKAVIDSSSSENLAKEILTYICKHLEAGIGAFYTVSSEDDKRIVEMQTSYALTLGESQTVKFEYGEGLVGQAALEEKTLIIDDIPEGYIKIVSGLGNATPTHLLVVPVKNGSELYGIVEIASFTELGKKEAEMVSAAFKEMTDKLFGKTVDSGKTKSGSKEDTAKKSSNKEK